MSTAVYNQWIICLLCCSNEEEVGVAIQQSGIPREEIFVVTKVCSLIKKNNNKSYSFL